jgi:hypothetical protein
MLALYFEANFSAVSFWGSHELANGLKDLFKLIVGTSTRVVSLLKNDE